MLEILIVDDSELARKRVVNIIATFDIDCKIVGQANDGVEALEMFKELTPNLVITDIEMPNMNGVDLLSNIHEIDSNVNIIVISSIASEQVRQIVKSSRHTIFVKKPINNQLLEAHILKIDSLMRKV